MDPYVLIGIEKGSSFEQAKQAYLRRVKVLHPDRFNQQKQKQEWLEANEMLRQLNIAWVRIEAEYKIESKTQQKNSSSPSSEKNSYSEESAFGYCSNCGNPVGEKCDFCSKCESGEAGIVQNSNIKSGISLILSTIFLFGFPFFCFLIASTSDSPELAFPLGVRLFLFCLMPHALIRFPKFFVSENSTGAWVVALGWFGNISIIMQLFFWGGIF